MTTASGATVRVATQDDAASCAAIYRPYVETTAVSFELEAPSTDEMRARIARTLERTPWLVVELEGTVRGYAYATRHRERPAYDWTAETAVYVDESFVGMGVGRTAMTALLELLRLQGFHLAVAGITLPNPASVALHQALGFHEVGVYPAIGWKLGRWHDTGWYAMELGPRAAVADPIRPLDEAMRDWGRGRS